MMKCNVGGARLSIMLFVFSLGSLAAVGQENFRFRHLSTGDGLSQSSVIAIAQDQKGLLWFGTRDGLNHYDGNQFTVYRNDPNDSTTLSNNDILEILVDTSGDLWIGTYNGLNKYSYAEDRFYRYFNEKDNPYSLANNSVWEITQMQNGEIWIGTGRGLNIYRDGIFYQIMHDPTDASSLSGDYVLDIFQDQFGAIWLGTSKGLNKVISQKDGKLTFRRFTHDPTDPRSISNNFVQTIAADSTGQLWIGTRGGGLQRLNPDTEEFTSYQFDSRDATTISHNDIRSLSFDAGGQLWAGTYNGLNKMVAEGKFIRILNEFSDPHSLTKNTIKSTFIDGKGSLWVGAYYGGINMLDETNANFVNYKQSVTGNGLSYNVVSSIIEDGKGTIYIGTEGGGINRLYPHTGAISYIKKEQGSGNLSSNNIKSLYLESGRYLWVGTFNTGIDIYDTESRRFTGHIDKESSLSHNSVYAILKESDALFWVGTFGGGLNLYNRKKKTSRVLVNNPSSSESLSDNQVRLLLKDARGNLWVGTQYGLNLLRKENIEKGDFRFKRFFYDEQKKSGEDILVIFQDSRSRIWVGTYESGLSLYDDAMESFISYQVFDPGNSNVIHGILEDDEKNLWISSNQGLTRFNPTDGITLSFDESDGMASNEFNNSACYKSSHGIMYFGGPDGLTSFRPEQIKTNKYAPKTIITDFRVFNQSVKAGAEDGILRQSITETKEITLDHDQAIFSLSFAIPNFINPDKNLYKYRLAGLEQSWNITHQNAATYTIQKPGNYVFEVKGANNDGVWSESISRLKIKVLPAPWRTWWAFLIYLILILLALYALLNIMLSRSRLMHQLELEHLENERQQSVNKMKLQFFTNISHEFRTPLTLILGPLEQIIQEYKGSNRVYKQLLVVEKNGLRLLKLINQLMDFRKFESKHEKLQAAEGNMVRFLEEIYLSFKNYAKIHHITYVFDKEAEHVPVWYDRDKMERVFYNLISNAFKYTDENGTIRISVRRQGAGAEFRFEDTGIGMEKEHLEKIFDRFYEVEEAQTHQRHKQQKGTGIGLAIAKGMVELHGGTISADSEKGKGTIFTVLLPLGKEHLREDQIIKDFIDSEDVSGYLKHNQEIDLTRETQVVETRDAPENEKAPLILVVEDNPSVRKFIVDIFKKEYRVEEAEDGMCGFKKAVQLVPDLIISDVMMPKMDGIELCMHTKSNLKTSHIPFILLTARTSLIFKFEGLESGADEYINKPFNIKELTLKAKNLLNIYTRLREKFTSESVVRPGEITVSSLDEKLLKRALEIIDENISNEFFNIQLFSSELGVSRTMLFTKVKAWTNLTPNEFIHSMRMKRAAQLLEQNKLMVSQVSYKVGFQNPKYFSKCFQKYHSLTPSEYAERFTVAAIEF